MTKKENEKIDLAKIDIKDLDFLKDIQMNETPIEEEYEEENHKQVKIQTIEEYFLELGFTSEMTPRKIHKEYPDVFGIRLDKKEKDDILSETPGVESPASLQLYASMLMYTHKK